MKAVDSGKQTLLLEAITELQRGYIQLKQPAAFFEKMLQYAVTLAEARVCLLADISHDPQGKPTLHVLARLIDQVATSHLDHPQPLCPSLLGLIGTSLRNQTPIVNNRTPESLPDSNNILPPIQNLLGVPLVVYGDLAGYLLIANRDEGFSQKACQILQPFFETCGFLLRSWQNQVEAERLRHELLLEQTIYAEALSSTMDVVVVADARQRIHFFNAGAEKLLGYTADEVRGRLIDCLLPEAYQGKHQQWVAAFSGRRHSLETPKGFIPARTVSGREIPLDASVSRIQIQGETYFIFIGQDATKRLETTRTLQLQQERLDLALTATSEGIWDWNLHTDDFYLSSQFLELLGYQKNDISESFQGFCNLFHPHEKQAITRHLLSYRQQQHPFRTELRLKTLNQGYQWFALRGKTLFDEQGHAYRMVGSLINITAQKKTEQALKQSEMRFRSYFELGVTGMAIINPMGSILEANQHFCQILGTTSRACFNAPFQQYLSEEDSKQLIEYFANVESGICDQIEMVVSIQRETESLYCDLAIRCVRKEQGTPDYYALALRNIDQEIKSREEISRLKTLLEAVMNASTQVAIIATDTNGIITVFNAGAERMLGYTADEMIGKRTPECFHLPDEIQQRSEELSKRFGKPVTGFDVLVEVARRDGVEEREWTYLTKNGKHIPVLLSVTVKHDDDGNIIGYLGIARDETNRKATEAWLNHMAHYDPLTNLANRALFNDRLHQSLLRAERDHRLLAVLFIDLDGFKAVNDQYGHLIGDLLLQEVAHRLQNAVRKSDSVARLGGDEFTVIIEDIRHRDDITRIANTIIETLSRPILIQDKAMLVSASIGIAINDSIHTDADDLLNRADQAMYQAKDNGKNQWVMDARSDQFLKQQAKTA